MRHDLRQEPYAVMPHVRICAGGAGQPALLPQPAEQARLLRWLALTRSPGDRQVYRRRAPCTGLSGLTRDNPVLSRLIFFASRGRVLVLNSM